MKKYTLPPNVSRPKWAAVVGFLPGLAATALLLLMLTAFPAPPPAVARESPPLTLWIHPYLPATELVQRFSPLTDYLATELDRPVHIRISQSYHQHVDFVGRDQADLAFMGPSSYVVMRRQHGDKPLLAILEDKGSAFFRGMIIVRQDSPRQQLAELQGESFAFGAPHSTMSYVVPRAMLAQAGVSLAELERHDFLDSHHNVALAVLGGYFTAGGVKGEVFQHYRPRGLRALATSGLVPEHLFLTRSNLAPALLARLRELLLALNRHPDGESILTSIKETLTGLQPASPAYYDGLATMMESLDDE